MPSFYEYTKSAKDVKKFVCEEKCKEIALAFDKFNADSGVYEFFGKILLEVAKEHYEMTFESTSIESYLKVNELEPPEFEKIEIEESWYDESQDIRSIGQKSYYYEVKPNYYWYTLWKIAKEYNCKNGCVVTQSPTIKYKGECYFEMSWGKEAEQCCTKEMWKRDAKDDCGIGLYVFCGIFLGLAIPCVLWLISICIITFLGKPENAIEITNKWNNLKYTIPICIFVFTAFFATIFRKIEIEYNLKNLSLKFEKHCKNIQENRESKYRF